jgi:NADH dehydrogenase
MHDMGDTKNMETGKPGSVRSDRRDATISPAQAAELAKLAASGALPSPSGSSTAPGKKRVVVLGGGFGGVYTAKYLTEALGGRDDVEVELLSDKNYFVFQPLLPEVAAGGIAATHVVNPIREIVPRARFRCCRVRWVDVANKRVYVSQGEGLELVAVAYDHLVFALGKVSSFAAMPGVEEHAFAMKDLADAFRLRNHVIRQLELADIETDADRQRALLTFVVAGGGFSGTETMGEIGELVHRSLRYFPRIAKKDVRFCLIHAQEHLLPELPEKLGVAAQRILEERGIEVVLSARVRAASRDRVFLADGSAIPTRTFVCTVGTAPNPVAKHAMTSGGLAEAETKGRALGIFAVDATLACVGSPGHWAVGDAAAVPHPKGQGFCPPTAQFAIREAKIAAHNVLAAIDGKKSKPFEFEVLGMLASLGQRRAVAQMFGVTFSGFIAWFMWRSVYLMKLPGMVRRLRVAIDWTLDLFFPRDITQLDADRPRRLDVRHYEAGEVIVQQGTIGRELFMITQGAVEVLGEGRGATSKVLARLGKQEVFGERALIEDTPRTATVRAASAVDVLVMSRDDFRSLVAQFQVLDEHFAQILRTRYPDAMGGATMLERVESDATVPHAVAQHHGVPQPSA